MRILLRISTLIIILAGVSSTQLAAQDAPTVFFGSLHSHTSLSDGKGTPAEAYAHARDVAGLDFLAIPEHSHAQAGNIANNPVLYTGPGTLSLIPTAQRFTEEGRFIALYGQERSTISSGNHMNVLDAPQVIDTASGHFRTLLQTWLPAHLDTMGQEPLLLLNHPATSNSPRNREYGIDDFDHDTARWLAALDPRAQLINLMNGPSHASGTGMDPGRPSESEFRRYLNLGLHVAPTADQDNHRRNWGNATDARTAVLAEHLTKASLLTAMRQRRVYATQDPNLRLEYRLNGKLLGSRITGGAVPAQGSALTISLVIADQDEPNTTYSIEVFSDQIGGNAQAAVVRTVTASGNGTVNIDGVTYDGGAQYVYLKIRQGDGDTAWTAPVWLEPDGGTVAPNEEDDHPFVVSLTVDVRAETAVITNVGTQPVALEGWRLVSVRGNQVFDQFPPDLTLEPGDAVTVTSGSGAQDGGGFIRWTRSNIWNNGGDPGQLFDVDGHLVAETGS